MAVRFPEIETLFLSDFNLQCVVVREVPFLNLFDVFLYTTTLRTYKRQHYCLL